MITCHPHCGCITNEHLHEHLVRLESLAAEQAQAAARIETKLDELLKHHRAARLGLSLSPNETKPTPPGDSHAP